MYIGHRCTEQAQIRMQHLDRTVSLQSVLTENALSRRHKPIYKKLQPISNKTEKKALIFDEDWKVHSEYTLSVPVAPNQVLWQTVNTQM